MSIRIEEVEKKMMPFAVKLPQVFDIKPAYEIELPAGRVAVVYAIKVEKDHDGHTGKSKVLDGWRVVIRTRRGTFINFNRYEHTGEVFTDPLLLNLRLKALVIEYAKKMKTTVEVTDLDD